MLNSAANATFRRIGDASVSTYVDESTNYFKRLRNEQRKHWSGYLDVCLSEVMFPKQFLVLQLDVMDRPTDLAQVRCFGIFNGRGKHFHFVSREQSSF